jgi:hypothetical protein
VRQGEKHNLRTRIADQAPVEGTHLGLVKPLTQGELRLQLLKRNTARRRIVSNTSEEDRFGFGKARMRKQQSRQFPACISADPGYRCAYSRRWLSAGRVR